MDSKIIGELEWDTRSNNDFVELLYGDKADLEELIIGSEIVDVQKNKIELTNGVIVELRGLTADGDASAGVQVMDYTPNLRITSVNLGSKILDNQEYTRVVTFYSNNREIAKLLFKANKGSKNVFSSASGFVINTKGYAILAA